MTERNDKLQAVARSLQVMGRVAVAFSGGVDSAFLLAFAQKVAGIEVVALTVASPLMPQSDIAFTRTFCAERHIPHTVLDVDPLADERVRSNTPERCYFCKRFIMEALMEQAHGLNACLCDGSNADDAADFRPGARALEELGVASPLADASLTKQEIREAARELGLSRWDEPASACLASRIPYGTRLDEAELQRIARAEQALREKGFRQVRVRSHGDIARIEVTGKDIERLVTPPMREKACALLQGLGFMYATLDLEGYRMGSLNEGISKP